MRALAITIVVIGLASATLPGLLLAAPPAETYVGTGIDPSGQLYILTKRHREIVPKKEPEQVGFARAEIAPDGRSVGWLALYPNSETDYPLPRKLVIYADGDQRSFSGTGLPIKRWCFEDGGREVAFEQETVRGGNDAHYELREITTGKLVENYDPDATAEMAAKPPRWVTDVNSNP